METKIFYYTDNALKSKDLMHIMLGNVAKDYLPLYYAEVYTINEKGVPYDVLSYLRSIVFQVQ